MKSDIEIAQDSKLKPIQEIADNLGLFTTEIHPFGNYIAKVDLSVLDKVKNNKQGKLILVTAMTPTHLGEGKTLTTVALSLGLNRIGKKAVAAVREPSLGPVFGVKGGAAGGGYSQILPMEEINLHFTGDIHAVGTAHNLLAAMVDNHLHQGNELNIDPNKVLWKRVLDMNDRALRDIVTGLGDSNGLVRESGFMITVASEVMAILCLSSSLEELRSRLSKIVVAFTYDKKPVMAKDLKADGAMTLLLKRAILPNLVQTTEATPAFVHGGPFANIAHGTNSIIADKVALGISDYVVTESGFGADLGAEKFFDIVCPAAGFFPSAVVIVATLRALKMHGGAKKGEYENKNIDALVSGLPNLSHHINTIRKFGISPVIALNKFAGDHDDEIAIVRDECRKLGASFAVNEGFAKGGEGAGELAKTVIESISDDPSSINSKKTVYSDNMSIKEKIEAIAKEIYGADEVEYSNRANAQIRLYEKSGFGGLKVCIAKTQSSISDNPLKKGVPERWHLTVREVLLSAGAGFVVPVCGEIMTMPGLPKRPSAEEIEIDENGKIKGLF